DVDAVAGEVDGREVIHGEVAQRMRRRSSGERGCTEDPEHANHDEESFHWSAFLATGAQRIEKWGLRASAWRSVLREASRSPRQRSIMPRWKCLRPPRGRRRSDCFEWPSASGQRPFL